jgi:hypothetical protein
VVIRRREPVALLFFFFEETGGCLSFQRHVDTDKLCSYSFCGSYPGETRLSACRLNILTGVTRYEAGVRATTAALPQDKDTESTAGRQAGRGALTCTEQNDKAGVVGWKKMTS